MRIAAQVFASFLVLSGLTEIAVSQPETNWSRLDVAAMSLIEEHGRVGNVSPERLFGASLVLQHARNLHRQGRDTEARALYYFVLTLVGQTVDEKQPRADKAANEVPSRSARNISCSPGAACGRA